MDSRLLVSCEHGGYQIPRAYATLFRRSQSSLRSHRGYDAGALWLARRVARHFAAPLFFSTTSRLLVDLNRSLHNWRVFSKPVRDLDARERARIVATYYAPHRRRIEQAIRRRLATGRRVLHLAVHSFTPELNGRVRNADIGLLYDPARAEELALCRRWQQLLREVAPDLLVRRNYPYRGSDDGLTPHLRRLFRPSTYLGVELELNQRLVRPSGTVNPDVLEAVRVTLSALLPSPRRPRRRQRAG